MTDQFNQVTPKTPAFNTHKVFAAIGIILTFAILAIAAIWYFSEGKSGTETEENSVKVTTSSAKPASNSATTSAE